MGDIINEEGEVMEVARTPMQKVKVKMAFPVAKHDMIRKIMKEKLFVY